MPARFFSSDKAPSPGGGYSQAVELIQVGKVVIVSGQIPVTVTDEVPVGFDAQCRLVWANVHAQLEAVGLDFPDIVKVTTYLGSREHTEPNSLIRREILGNLQPTLTVIIAGIYDPAWLLEIEVIAAR
jgi:2-iminobutanoate/2-iminopropanoate deaminase